MRRVTSSPNFAPRVLVEHIPQVVALDPRPKADAVVTRQVGGGLRWRDQVIDRQRVLGVRQADFHDFRAEDCQNLDGRADFFLDFRLDAFDEIFLRDADADAPQVCSRYPGSTGVAGTSCVVASSGSRPCMTEKTAAASAASRASTPQQSSDEP